MQEKETQAAEPMIDGDKLLTAKQLIELLQISRTTLYRYVKSGKVKPVVAMPRANRYRLSDVIEQLSAE